MHLHDILDDVFVLLVTLRSAVLVLSPGSRCCGNICNHLGTVHIYLSRGSTWARYRPREIGTQYSVPGSETIHPFCSVDLFLVELNWNLR